MSGTPLRFVIQEHGTEYPHHDLRLELGGVRMSWILPKGVPTEGGRKRLAVEDKEENLPSFDSRTVIEDGYGRGEAKVWDSGIHEVKRKEKTKIIFEAKGEKFFGRFILLLPSWGRWTKKRLWVLIKL